jgi:hypothetical protein
MSPGITHTIAAAPLPRGARPRGEHAQRRLELAKRHCLRLVLAEGMVAVTPVDRVVHALEAAGSNPRQHGDQWQARCPAHDDKNPSLGVATGRDGRALVKCQAGCDLGDVVAAVGLTKADLFSESKTEEDRSRITAKYNYTDEHGTLLFQAVRFEPKSFRYRRPIGKGGWIWNLQDTRRVLYRLPEVLAAVGTQTVFLVEGEKDADAIVRAGEVATTCPMGADSWRPEYAEAFASLNHVEVVIVADKDENGQGYRHARAVAESLKTVPVDSVTVAMSKFGKDAADHLSAGYSLDDLEVLEWDELVELCGPGPSEEHSDDANRGGIKPIDWPKFWANETPAADFLIEPVVAAGRGTAIYSSAKAGKSLLLLDMAAAAVTGRGALGQPARPPIRIVYLDLEMVEADLRERLSDLGYGPDDDLSGLAYFQATELPSLDSELGGTELADIARDHRAHLVIVDTMARVVVGPENDTDTYRAFYRHTGSRLKALGIALCRLDHEGKDGSRGQRGASGKNDDVDVVYRLSADGNQLRLRRTHTRVPWIPPELSIVRHEEPHLRHVVTTEDTWPAGTAEVAGLLDDLEVPLDATVRMATTALKAVNRGRRVAVVTAALKLRRTRP